MKKYRLEIRFTIQIFLLALVALITAYFVNQ